MAKEAGLKESLRERVRDEIFSRLDPKTCTISFSGGEIGAMFFRSGAYINEVVRELCDAGELLRIKRGVGDCPSVYIIPDNASVMQSPVETPLPLPFLMEPPPPGIFPEDGRLLDVARAILEMVEEQRRTNHLLTELLQVWGGTRA